MIPTSLRSVVEALSSGPSGSRTNPVLYFFVRDVLPCLAVSVGTRSLCAMHVLFIGHFALVFVLPWWSSGARPPRTREEFHAVIRGTVDYLPCLSGMAIVGPVLETVFGRGLAVHGVFPLSASASSPCPRLLDLLWTVALAAGLSQTHAGPTGRHAALFWLAHVWNRFLAMGWLACNLTLLLKSIWASWTKSAKDQPPPALPQIVSSTYLCLLAGEGRYFFDSGFTLVKLDLEQLVTYCKLLKRAWCAKGPAYMIRWSVRAFFLARRRAQLRRAPRGATTETAQMPTAAEAAGRLSAGRERPVGGDGDALAGTDVGRSEGFDSITESETASLDSTATTGSGLGDGPLELSPSHAAAAPDGDAAASVRLSVDSERSSVDIPRGGAELAGLHAVQVLTTEGTGPQHAPPTEVVSGGHSVEQQLIVQSVEDAEAVGLRDPVAAVLAQSARVTVEPHQPAVEDAMAPYVREEIKAVEGSEAGQWRRAAPDQEVGSGPELDEPPAEAKAVDEAGVVPPTTHSPGVEAAEVVHRHAPAEIEAAADVVLQAEGHAAAGVVAATTAGAMQAEAWHDDDSKVDDAGSSDNGSAPAAVPHSSSSADASPAQRAMEAPPSVQHGPPRTGSSTLNPTARPFTGTPPSFSSGGSRGHATGPSHAGVGRTSFDWPQMPPTRLQASATPRSDANGVAHRQPAYGSSQAWTGLQTPNPFGVPPYPGPLVTTTEQTGGQGRAAAVAPTMAEPLPGQGQGPGQYGGMQHQVDNGAAGLRYTEGTTASPASPASFSLGSAGPIGGGWQQARPNARAAPPRPNAHGVLHPQSAYGNAAPAGWAGQSAAGGVGATAGVAQERVELVNSLREMQRELHTWAADMARADSLNRPRAVNDRGLPAAASDGGDVLGGLDQASFSWPPTGRMAAAGTATAAARPYVGEARHLHPLGTSSGVQRGLAAADTDGPASGAGGNQHTVPPPAPQHAGLAPLALSDHELSELEGGHGGHAAGQPGQDDNDAGTTLGAVSVGSSAGVAVVGEVRHRPSASPFNEDSFLEALTRPTELVGIVTETHIHAIQQPLAPAAGAVGAVHGSAQEEEKEVGTEQGGSQAQGGGGESEELPPIDKLLKELEGEGDSKLTKRQRKRRKQKDKKKAVQEGRQAKQQQQEGQGRGKKGGKTAKQTQEQKKGEKRPAQSTAGLKQDSKGSESSDSSDDSDSDYDSDDYEEEDDEDAKADFLMDAVPDHCKCAISLGIMADPVIASDGHAYERREIETWINKCREKKQPVTSPLHGDAMEAVLVEDVELRKEIEREVAKALKAWRRTRRRSTG